MIRTIVVFPAPFGPSRAKMVPSSTVTPMPSSTTLSPKDFRKPVVLTAELKSGCVMLHRDRCRPCRRGEW